jgi:Hg(II)-responsive transcriptional regulator
LTPYYTTGSIIERRMTLTIGAVAKGAGVGVETLRYYERRGLLSKAGRTQAGYRQFPDSEVRRVKFIRRAQGLGFTLEEIGELLELRVDGGRRCVGVERAARSARERVHERLLELRRMDKVLSGLVTACQQRRNTDACPILASLEDGESE